MTVISITSSTSSIGEQLNIYVLRGTWFSYRRVTLGFVIGLKFDPGQELQAPADIQLLGGTGYVDF